jgi:hypothetical protein
MTAALVALIGALFVAPFVWSMLVALARRAAIGSRDDAHEKAILALMLAPLGLGVVLLVLPGESVSAIAPPLLDWVELPAQAVVGTGGGDASGAAPLDWLLITALTLLVIYALGVVRYATPLIKAHLRLHRWVKAAQASESLSVHVSDHAQTPIAVSNKRILFPRHLLDALSAEQVRLIIAHEGHHHARGDVAFYALLAWIDVAFWFNPFVRGQTQHCRLAAELECDAAVTAASPDMRRAYAQTLLVVLKHSAGHATPCAPAMFSHRALGENRMRILQIMKSDAPRKRAPWFAYVVACALTAPLGIVQLALAQSGNDPFVLTAPSPISALSSDAVMPDRSVFTHRPLEGRLVGTYGQRIDPQTGEPTFHPGVDIEAPFGTRVFAPADGRVIRAVAHPEYGNLIEIDHGDGLATRYAHLSAFDVRDGDAVQPGQVIGRVGNSGRSTRTQLHIEVWRRDRAWDPSMVLDLPASD